MRRIIYLQEKRCTKCGTIKPLDRFTHLVRRGISGFYARCRDCMAIKKRAWELKNPVKVKAMNKKQNSKNTERKRLASAKWRKENPEKAREFQKNSRVRREATPKGKLRKSMSGGMRKSILNGAKAGRHWESLVDFTVDQLREHLEKKFKPGMAWSNYGEWHIDHKIPVAVFNFGTPEDLDFKRCWALKNLQPMWAKDNMKKHSKLIKPFQPSLKMGGVLTPGH